MLIRTHPYMNVLYSTRQTTLRELPKFAAGASLRPSSCQWQERWSAVKDLYRYVADLELLVCGPQYWFSSGVDGRPETKFTLEIALPVQGKIPTALLPYFKQIPAFRCLSYRYEGPWEGLAGAYREMMQYIEDNQLRMKGVYAESFLHIDLEDPASQITEIQIGLI